MMQKCTLVIDALVAASSASYDAASAFIIWVGAEWQYMGGSWRLVVPSGHPDVHWSVWASG